MAKKRKWILIIVAVFGIIPLIAIVFWVKIFGPILFVFSGPQQATQMRVRLLCETDHQALLKDGREILSKVPHLVNQTKDGYKIVGSLPVPKEIQIPKSIKDIQPRAVLINNSGSLTIEMHGGMDHFGVIIYPEDSNEPRSDYLYGRKLIPGLRYYDDGYLHNPEYDKRIDELIKKGK